MDGIYSLPQIKAALTPVFGKYDVNRAILFGSYAKGTATMKSDVDILVDCKLRGLRFMGLVDDVCTILGKDADIFNVSHIIPDSPIDHEIHQTGVLLYEK